MRVLQTAAKLESFERRAAGTDAERRAAAWLAAELGAGGREAVIEPFWARPNWPLAHAWHVALALAGSLVAVSSPRAGGALLLAALVLVLADEFTGQSPGRWLTRARASQNVVGSPPAASEQNLRLVITANYDAGRAGLAFRDPLRRSAARLRKAARGSTLGWLGWLAIAIVWLLVVAIIRLQGHHSTGVGLVQLPPTIGLVLALALLLDLATSEPSPAAGDNATGVAVALELARALDAAPPKHVDVEVVLTGASDRDRLGLRRYLRARKGSLGPGNTAVIGLAGCAGGEPVWWRSEGALLPVRSAPRLKALAAALAGEHSDRSTTPAAAALATRIPAITIGAVSPPGVAPRSHQLQDTAAAIDQRAVERVLELALVLVDAIDASLGQPRAGAPTPA